MNDNELEQLSYEIDDIIFELIQKYSASPINVSAIIIARLMRIAMETNDVVELKTIMELALDKKDSIKNTLQ